MESEMRIKEMEKNDLSKLKDGEAPKKHEILFSDECSSLYSSSRPEAKYEFDYEINSILFKEEKGQENMYMRVRNKMFGDKLVPVNLQDLYDNLDFSSTGDEKILHNQGDTKLAKANIFKRLVSKKKEDYKLNFLI